MALAIGLPSFVLHVLAGPGHLDDIDAINFTLGIRDFDVSRHQPHPPGYPVLIGAAKLVGAGSSLVRTLPGSWSTVPVETATLSLLAMIAGGLFVVAMRPLALAVGGDEETAFIAGLLAIVCPLTLVTVSRPLSDAPGLAAALGVQALLATAFLRQRGWRDREIQASELAATGRLVVLAAFAAGLALGVRSQTVWLTVPLLVVVIADRAGRAAAAAIVGSLVTFTAGVLAWAIPLIVASGGPAAYWRAIASQAGEDLEGVDMLFTSTRPLWRLAMNLLQTFVLPWGPLSIAVVVLSLAALGLFVLVRRDRRALVLLAGAAAPYTAFHLLWQENVTTRYALPIVPAVAILAAIGVRQFRLSFAPHRTWLVSGPRRVGAAALSCLCLAAGLPALTAYTREPAPVFRLFGDMRAAAPPGRAVVAMHRRSYSDTNRVRGWLGAQGFPWRLLPSPVGHEWLEIVRYWLEGGTERVWLLADLRRTDLALIDPAGRHPKGHYDWSTPLAAGVLGGTRPGALDWVVIEGPAWFLGQGWALSPEIAGVSNADGKGPEKGGAVGWMRSLPVPRRLVIGGRNLGAADAPPARFTLTSGGKVLDTWDVPARPGFFLRSIDVPAATGVGPDPASTSAQTSSGSGSDSDSDSDSDSGQVRTRHGSRPGLEQFVVTSAAADGSGRIVPTAIEQFDLQPRDRVQFGFAEGWFEDEYQPRTGLRWRWASGEAWLQVWPVDRDVRVRIVVESPLKTFDEAPIVTLSAGGREFSRVIPGDAFVLDQIVPADALRAANGRIALRSSRTFVPAEHVGASDPRHNDRRALALRVFEASVADAHGALPQR